MGCPRWASRRIRGVTPITSCDDRPAFLYAANEQDLLRCQRLAAPGREHKDVSAPTTDRLALVLGKEEAQETLYCRRGEGWMQLQLELASISRINSALLKGTSKAVTTWGLHASMFRSNQPTRTKRY